MRSDLDWQVEFNQNAKSANLQKEKDEDKVRTFALTNALSEMQKAETVAAQEMKEDLMKNLEE